MPEHVALGVAHPQQLRCPATSSVVRRAGQQNQLRRLRADEHLRHGRRGERLAGQRRLARPSSSRRPAASRSCPAACPPASTGPSTSAAFSQDCVVAQVVACFVGPCWKRSQLVLTANFRSLSLIGLQIGSPSRLTSTAGVLLKKIVGGSAFTPSTFFGMIWLLSTLASTRSSAITRSSFGHRLVDLRRRPRADLLLGSVWKFASTIFIFCEADQPLGERHLRVGFELDGAERRLLAPLRAVRHRAERDHVLLLVPARDLRLIDEDGAAAWQVVDARPAAVDRRGGGRGRGGRLRPDAAGFGAAVAGCPRLSAWQAWPRRAWDVAATSRAGAGCREAERHDRGHSHGAQACRVSWSSFLRRR